MKRLKIYKIMDRKKLLGYDFEIDSSEAPFKEFKSACSNAIKNKIEKIMPIVLNHANGKVSIDIERMKKDTVLELKFLFNLLYNTKYYNNAILMNSDLFDIEEIQY